MRQGKIVVKNAYITEYQTIPDVRENSSFNPEGPIPELYIQVVKTAGTRIVDYQLYTKDGNIFNPNVDAVQFYWEFGCGHKQETSTSSAASHQYDVDGNYTPSVYVFTPNYSEEISELRTPTGRILDLIDSTPSQLPPEAVEETEEVTETTTEELPILESAFDGKIVGWNGNGLAPFYSAGSSRSSAGTRWWVQNGHTRALASNSQNLQDALRSLVGQEPEDDILLSRDIINDLRIGPNLDYTNFGNPTENEIQRIITVDWRDEGNPDDFQTNRNAREDAAPPVNSQQITITGNYIIETQGDPFENRPEFETLDIEFPSNMTYTQIGANIQPVETPTESGTNLTMFFNSGNNIVLTFPPSVNGQSFLRAEVFGGGTTNNSLRQVSFDTDSDKEIVLTYGIQP